MAHPGGAYHYVVERLVLVKRVRTRVDGHLLALDEAAGGAVLALQHLARLAVGLEVPVQRRAPQQMLRRVGAGR